MVRSVSQLYQNTLEIVFTVLDYKIWIDLEKIHMVEEGRDHVRTD